MDSTTVVHAAPDLAIRAQSLPGAGDAPGPSGTQEQLGPGTGDTPGPSGSQEPLGFVTGPSSTSVEDTTNPVGKKPMDGEAVPAREEPTRSEVKEPAGPADPVLNR